MFLSIEKKEKMVMKNLKRKKEKGMCKEKKEKKKTAKSAVLQVSVSVGMRKSQECSCQSDSLVQAASV